MSSFWPISSDVVNHKFARIGRVSVTSRKLIGGFAGKSCINGIAWSLSLVLASALAATLSRRSRVVSLEGLLYAVYAETRGKAILVRLECGDYNWREVCRCLPEQSRFQEISLITFNNVPTC